MRRPSGFLLALSVAAVTSGCAGGGAQGLSGLMPPGNGALVGGGASGPVPSGATVMKVHLPWAFPAPAPTSGTRPGLPSAVPFMPMVTAPPPATPPPTNSPNGYAASNPVQAMSISIVGAFAATQTIALTAGSSACSSTPSGSTCQLVFGLAPGTYTATATLFSSANASPLSALGPPQAIGFTVSSAGGTTVNVAIGTVPASLSLAPANPFGAQNAVGGIDLYGAGKHQLLAEMLDANGNVILSPASVSYTIAPVGGQVPLTVVPSFSTPPNLFTVAYTGPASGTATGALRVTAGITGPGTNACMQPGAVCSGTVNVDVKQVLAVANSSANTVTLYTNPQNPPVATVTNGLVDPQALVFDANGDLFVASQPSSVIEYVPPYTGPPNTIGVGVNHPQALALDARGDLFVANGNGSNTVTEYVAPYTGGPMTTIANDVSDPVSLGLDASNDLFVANSAANTVTLYTPPYNGMPTTIANGLNAPNSVAIDARGNLFVSNLNSTPNSVLEYVPPFSSGSAPSAWITNGINEQGAIAVNGSSNLFVPNQGANTVTAYGPPFTGAPTTIKGGQSQPVALAVDALGNLFVANYGNNTVTQYPPPYAGVSWITIANGVSSPQALALSPATNL